MRFAPGARTGWHKHAVGQTLDVTDGLGLIQSRDGKIIEIRPGDTIQTPQRRSPTDEPCRSALSGGFDVGAVDDVFSFRAGG